MILDGEIVAFDAAGRPSFQALQNRVQARTEREIAAAERQSPVVFYCFDLLHFAGLDLRGAPWAERRRWLAQCLLPSGLVQLVHAQEDGPALYGAALVTGFEGVVGKRKDSRYEVGRRSGAWLKVKAMQSGEFLVGGHTKGKGARAALGALLVGYREAGKLIYASHVGSGFDGPTLAALQGRLRTLETGRCPFARRPEVNGPVTWVEPRLVVEVRFQGWTEEGALRAPVFLRVREDKAPEEVIRPQAARARQRQAPPGADAQIEEVLRQMENPKPAFTLAVGPQRIRLTHLDRVYWPADPLLRQPALTKRELLRYFAQVSPFLLPQIADRPLTAIRMPEGIVGPRFFQKHWGEERPGFVETLTVFSEHKDEPHEVLLCNNLATLLWLAQGGALELHVWHSRARSGPDAAGAGTDYASSAAALDASVLSYPDWVVFDLDPYIYSGKEAPGAEPELNTAAFEKCKEVAFHLRELLAAMGLQALVKTSGKTGLHVFVPVRRTLDFDAARRISELVGRHLARAHPRDITLEWSVPKRSGKIFMDYTMNVRGKTLNAAYSPRGVPGAPVSVPLTWDELANAHPLDFRIPNVVQRLAQAGDPWRDALTRKQGLEQLLEV
jgi:bifunctional non-homologous end joining protein LigD